MAFEDKTMTCVECGTSFTFTKEEQELFQTRGFTNEPKRCPECRKKRKAQQRFSGGFSGGYSGGYSGRGSMGPRESFPIVCFKCGKEATVPFRPRKDRPVYCADCYKTAAK